MSGLQKNVTGQKWRVFAFDITDGSAKTGDAANISAKIAKDWAAAGATNDVAPTEVEDGYYLFDLTQAETNADVLDLYPESSTGNIQVVGVPGTIFTVAPNFAALGIESDGDLTKVNTLDGHTAQTADHTAGIADVPTVAEFNARTLAAAAYFDPAADTVANVTTVATLTGHTPQTADHSAGISDIPTVAEFNARTLVAASYFDPAADTVATVTTVTNGVTLAAGAVSNAALSGNMEIVFETDFATNYNTTRNAWVINYTDYIGTIPAAALGADCITAAKIADGAFVAVNFSAGSLDGKGDWNTVVPDAAGVAPTAAENADAIWDEVLAGHLGAGSTGNALNAAGAAGDPWSTVIPGAYGAGTAGKIVGDNVDAPISTVDTVVDTIAVDVAGLDGDAMRGTDSASTAAALAATYLVVDAIAVDVAGLDGDAMRGTDSAALASVCTEARLAELDAANLPADVDTLVTQVGTAGDGLTNINLPNQTMDIVGNVTGNLSGSVGSVSGAVGSVTAEVTADAVKISGSSDAADKLEASAETMLIGTVSHDNTIATTTVFYCDDITEATADHFNGRIVIFTSGDLIRQATDITDYELSVGEGKFTVTALTELPADNVTFIIV